MFHLSSLILLFFVPLILGNTEIVNFSISETTDVQFSEGEWIVLSPNSSEIQWNITAAPLDTDIRSLCNNGTTGKPILDDDLCSYALWLVLDLDQPEWKSYKKFTIRLSWAASLSSDFFIDIYDPEFVLPSAVIPSSNRKTSRKFARILAVDTAVRTPKVSSKVYPVSEKPVIPVIIILEPLLLGVIPSSVIPVILFIILLSAICIAVIPSINNHLQGIASSALSEYLSNAEKEE